MTSILATITMIYGTAGATAVLMQAHKIMARHSSADVSIRYLITGVIGNGLYLAYGLALHNPPLIVSDAVGVICVTATITAAFIYRERKSGE